MKHPFAIGSTIKTVRGHRLVVLGYVETPVGGEVITCDEGDYSVFDNNVRVFHGDPSLYTQVASDLIEAIAERYAEGYADSPDFLSVTIANAICEYRDAL